MTERKPPGVSFETWIDRQVRESIDRGEFDDLPGAGKPIPGIDRPHDEMWWVKEKLRRENVSMLPPTLVLRKEVEQALNAAATSNSELKAAQIVGEINEKIRRANSRPLDGPPLNLAPYDVERILEHWRADHPELGAQAVSVDPDVQPVVARSSRWASWRDRITRRR
jgi:hypothetical protein